VLIDPARSGKPKDKPQVERPMPYIRDSFWRGREETFTSLAQMRAEAVRWCLQVAGQRQCRPLEGAAPLSVFRSVEQPALMGLPGAAFELATWSRGKVGPDIHVKVGKTPTRCRGSTSARPSMPAPPRTRCSCSSRVS
jgi:hypothetical protein